MSTRSRQPATLNPLVATFHGVLLLLVLGLAIGWPRAGQAALLLPLASSPPSEALAWLRANDAAVLGLARIGGGLVMRVTHDETAFAALEQGWLLIAVPEAACSFDTPTTRRT